MGCCSRDCKAPGICSGYDAIIVEGKADKPLYLWGYDGESDINDAGNIRGKETKETEGAIRPELGDDHIHVAIIGQAGENQVPFACIMAGCHTCMVELLKIAERTVTLMRLLNVREGLTATDDMLPERFFQPKTEGVLATISIDRNKYEKAKKYYYLLMGWD